MKTCLSLRFQNQPITEIPVNSIAYVLNQEKKSQNLTHSALKILPWWRFWLLSTLVTNKKGTEPKEICSVGGCDKFWDPERLSLASESLTVEIFFILNVWFSYKVHRLESAFPLSNSTRAVIILQLLYTLIFRDKNNLKKFLFGRENWQ